MKNTIVKDTLAITLITLVAGLALGVVQDITAEPIAKQEALAKEKAYKAVFADADSFEPVLTEENEAMETRGFPGPPIRWKQQIMNPHL